MNSDAVDGSAGATVPAPEVDVRGPPRGGEEAKRQSDLIDDDVGPSREEGSYGTG